MAVTFTMWANSPRTFAETGVAIKRVKVDVGDLYEDALGAGPYEPTPLKRAFTPKGGND